MKIIGFAGKRCSGKSLGSDFFVEFSLEAYLPFTKVSFISVIRELFAYDKGIKSELLDLPWAREEYLPQMFEFIDRKRKEDKFYFEKYFFDCLPSTSSIVIEDVSTLEQLEAVWRLGGKVYKIQADKGTLMARGWTYVKEIDDSIFETELANLDPHTFTPYGGYIYNNGSLMDFKAQIYKIFRNEVVSNITIE